MRTNFEKGQAAERVNTEKERQRADCERERANNEKERADILEQENLRLKEQLALLKKSN